MENGLFPSVTILLNGKAASRGQKSSHAAVILHCVLYCDHGLNEVSTCVAVEFQITVAGDGRSLLSTQILTSKCHSAPLSAFIK